MVLLMFKVKLNQSKGGEIENYTRQAEAGAIHVKDELLC